MAKVIDELITRETMAEAEKIGISFKHLRNDGFDLPTQTAVIRWIRETYGYVISPNVGSGTKYVGAAYVYTSYFIVRRIDNILSKGPINNCRRQFATMEEAYEEGIRKVLTKLAEK